MLAEVKRVLKSDGIIASRELVGTSCFLLRFIGGWFFMPEIIAAAIKCGLANQQLFDEVCVAPDKWSSEAGAIGGIEECIASKP